MPDKKGGFHLYYDTGKFATGCGLHQIQSGQPRQIAYASTKMPIAAQNHSVTEQELCGLVMYSISLLLQTVDLDTIVDHLTLTHIMKSKSEPETNMIK